MTDTTWLDCVGIPVFASIRPSAIEGSLCVNAGKGARPEEAEVGAYMEAIEFAYAEPARHRRRVERSTPRAIGSQSPGFDFLDLCPSRLARVDPDGPIDAVTATDLATGDERLVPAELVFSPYHSAQQTPFGTTTNGLASGNNIDEATAHGLFEVMERDVESFHHFEDRSTAIAPAPAGSLLADLVGKVEASGLSVVLRGTENDFDLPYVQGYILEPDLSAPIAISFGAGLHADAEVAAVRAVSEAAQSRLSYIHGGRDDLVHRYQHFGSQQPGTELSELTVLRERLYDGDDLRPLLSVGSVTSMPRSVDKMIDGTRRAIRALARIGAREVLRVVLTPPGSDLAVVRVIVPKLEHFDPKQQRIGRRLANAFTTSTAVA